MFLLIDKPTEMTSHDVINKLRKITGEKRIGHAGTLDPFASGLLIVGVGRQTTKLLGPITKDTTKTYEATICLGEQRDTDDIEGKVVQSNDTVKPSLHEVEEVLKSFTGRQEQIPPSYSAIKLQGKKMYELARKGNAVVLEPRIVTIHSLELLKYTYPDIECSCTVSSGTYIRALARDIGGKLETYAYLSKLRRTKIGEIDVEMAVPLSSLTNENWKSYSRDSL